MASNFSGAMKAIVSEYEETSEHKIVLAFGSTGKHYAQIINGAPFDLFLAADSARPQLLEDQGIAIIGSRTTYARGRLAVWASNPEIKDIKVALNNHEDMRHLAFANPKLSPYGIAAQQVLMRQSLHIDLGHAHRLQPTQHAQFGVGITQAIEHHDPDQRFNINAVAEKGVHAQFLTCHVDEEVAA